MEINDLVLNSGSTVSNAFNPNFSLHISVVRTVVDSFHRLVVNMKQFTLNTYKIVLCT